MLSRKILVAVYVSLLAIVCLTLFESFFESFSVEDGELIMVLFFYSIYVVPIVFIYGITSSLIAEKISGKMVNFKNFVSFGLHILFGAGFIIPYSLFFEYKPFPELTVVNVLTDPVTIFGALFSILFFILDYILRKKDSRQKSIPI